METNHINQSPIDLETLIGGLKSEDSRNLKLMHKMQSVMWGIAAVYLLISVLKFIMTTPWYDKLGGFLVLLAFVAFALYFRNYYKEYKSIDYGIPTIEMLKKAARRHGIQWRGLYFLAPLILEGIGLNLMMYDDFTKFDPLYRILFFQTIYFFVMAIAFLVGYFIWKKRQKPLRDQAQALLKEIQS
jgi:riboflavin transporter FmnP